MDNIGYYSETSEEQQIIGKETTADQFDAAVCN